MEYPRSGERSYSFENPSNSFPNFLFLITISRDTRRNSTHPVDSSIFNEFGAEMSQMTLENRGTMRFADVPKNRFYKANSPAPGKPKMDNSCPYCHHALANEHPHPHTIQRLKAGFGHLFTAVFIIVFSVFRLARLIVAMAFSLVGLIGFGLHNVGQRIVHPNDRRLLPLRDRQNDYYA